MPYSKAFASQPFGVGVAAHQVTIIVLDPEGKPLSGAKVKLYNRLPFYFITEVDTDETGTAYIDGLLPWFYVFAADYEPRNLTTPPVCLNIEPGKTYTYKLTATPPPHLYEMKIHCGLVPAELAKWLVENVGFIRDAIIGFPNHEFVKAWTEDSFLYIQFRVKGSPFPWAAIAAILAILIVLAIIGWEVKEIVSKLPTFFWYALGATMLGLVGLGIYGAVRRRE
jgi:hypothetical protein